MCLSSQFFKVLFLFIYTKFDLVYMYMTVDLIVQFIYCESNLMYYRNNNYNFTCISLLYELNLFYFHCIILVENLTLFSVTHFTIWEGSLEVLFQAFWLVHAQLRFCHIDQGGHKLCIFVFEK